MLMRRLFCFTRRELDSRAIDLLLVFIFISCLILHLKFSFAGWDNPLLDIHNFRQTQTAMTSFYVIKEGFRLDYITPVLGPPWSIPLEFPLYQWIVALIVIIFHSPLEQSGRFITLLFFYLSLVPIYLLLGYFVMSKSRRLIFLSLILLTPTYLYWSRAFTIESLALFLSLMFLFNAARAAEKRQRPSFIFAIAFGILAILVKVTTFVVFCLPTFLFFLWFMKREGGQERSASLAGRLIFKKYIVYCAIMLILPFIANFVWTAYADYQKSLNPLAISLLSKNLHNWVFGTWAQKMSLGAWKQIYFNSGILPCIFYSPLGLIMLFGFYISTRFRSRKIMVFILSGICFLSGPLIFTNLYFRHDYYFYSSNLFLLFMLGFIVISIMDYKKNRFRFSVALVIYCLLLLHLLGGYLYAYYPRQIKQDLSVKYIGELIKKSTNEGDIIFVTGDEWNSRIPYYAQRRAIMDGSCLSINDANLQGSLARLKDESLCINAMVIFGTNASRKYIDERIGYFELDPTPVFSTPLCTLFKSRKNN
jgi:hypothetical protein